ncbi:hypothetical protein D3C79_686330 [compost metagenome]
MLPDHSALGGHNSLLRITWHRGHQRGSSGGGSLCGGQLAEYRRRLRVAGPFSPGVAITACYGSREPVRRAACRVPEEAACCRVVQPWMAITACCVWLWLGKTKKRRLFAFFESLNETKIKLWLCHEFWQRGYQYLRLVMLARHRKDQYR